MYEMHLKESLFPEQLDAELWDITVGELLRDIAATYPCSEAVVEVDENGDRALCLTYQEVLDTSERLAVALGTRFVRGEKIVVWAPNISQWIILEYACALAGLVVVTANPSFQEPELRYVLEQSGATGLFLVDNYRGNPMREIAHKAIKGNSVVKEMTNLLDGDALYRRAGETNQLPDIPPSDPAQIQYTSGTTGFPKGAVLSHNNLVNNARLFCERKKVGQHSIWANFMPLFHTAGCATGTLGCLQAACRMILIQGFDANVLAKIIEQEGITTFFAVPTMLVGLLEAIEIQPRNMKSLEVISTGGAPVAPELVRQVRTKLGCHLLTAFGQTEASPMISLNHDDVTLDDICETAGQPLPRTAVSIRSPETNSVLPLNTVGEICAKSYGVMIGYHDNPEATEAAIDDNNWLHTGDLGMMDLRGFIRVTGRVKDMIIRGGENHFPAEIESVMLEHPAVNEIAIVGLPDPKWGEIIAAFIRTESAGALKADELKVHCRTFLSRQKTPTKWVVVDEFPMTGSGKVQKFAIREKWLSGKYGVEIHDNSN